MASHFEFNRLRKDHRTVPKCPLVTGNKHVVFSRLRTVLVEKVPNNESSILSNGKITEYAGR